MIDVIGIKGSSEHRAAISVADAIKALWPDIESSPNEQDQVCIASNVKISGYRRGDIDIVICGRFIRPRYFRPQKALRDNDGNRLLMNRPVRVDSFVVAVEVKDHSGSAVRVTGEKIEVRYTRSGPTKWSSATDQNIEQVHSLRPYLEDRIGSSPFVHRCLVLPNLQRLRCAGTVVSGFTGHQLFTAIAETSPMRVLQGTPTLRAGNAKIMQEVLACRLFKEIAPSSLDRRHMDRIAQKSPATEAILKNAGNRMTLLRGHGGTGKTVALLQAAWRLFRERGERTLFLTYNHALAADIRRLMTLLGVPATPEDGGIAVETVMSFMYSWLAELQLLDDGESADYDDYSRLLAEAMEHFNVGTVSKEDIEELLAKRPDRFDFDHVFVDEGQDWPANEVRLLKALYGAPRLCIADGVEQLTRGEHVDWVRGVPAEIRSVIPLTACLRMKRSLALFAAEAAERANLGWDMAASEKAVGGRIVISRTPYSAQKGLHEELLAKARAKGNSEIDFLFCVPPSNVSRHEAGLESHIAKTLASWGHETWDGVDPLIRSDFPRSTSEFRVVQYESCRGLEGWTVVLEGLDELIEIKKSTKLRRGLTDQEREAFVDVGTVANRFAWRHALIALTRPIDTLVITLGNSGSAAGRELLGLAQAFPDFVEVLGE